MWSVAESNNPTAGLYQNIQRTVKLVSVKLKKPVIFGKINEIEDIVGQIKKNQGYLFIAYFELMIFFWVINFLNGKLFEFARFFLTNNVLDFCRKFGMPLPKIEKMKSCVCPC